MDKKIKGKNVHLAMSIYGKNNNIRIFKDVIRVLGSPKYICLRIKNKDSIALLASNVKENMSFKVPNDLFINPHSQFIITSKQFVTSTLCNNEMTNQQSYRLIGYYSDKENAVFFNTNNSAIVKNEKRKNIE